MFNNPKEGGETKDTIISSSVRIEGDFIGRSNVIVEGEVIGTLKTTGNLYVQKGAKIEAEVEARTLELSGSIKGNIKIKEKAELSSSAHIMGNLEANTLSVEAGAVLNGQCNIVSQGETKEQKKLESKKEKK